MLLEALAAEFGLDERLVVDLLAGDACTESIIGELRDQTAEAYLRWLPRLIIRSLPGAAPCRSSGLVVDSLLVPPFGGPATSFVHRIALLSAGQRRAVRAFLEQCVASEPPGCGLDYRQLGLLHAIDEFWSDPTDARLWSYLPAESEQSVREAVLAGFPVSGPPNPNDLMAAFPDETASLRSDFGCKTWLELADEWAKRGTRSRLWYHMDAIRHMGPVALRHYLPAYMLATLDDPYHDLADRLTRCLELPGDSAAATRFGQFVRHLSIHQREIVRRFLEFLGAEYYRPYPDCASGILSDAEIRDQAVVWRALDEFWRTPSDEYLELFERSFPWGLGG